MNYVFQTSKIFGRYTYKVYFGLSIYTASIIRSCNGTWEMSVENANGYLVYNAAFNKKSAALDYLNNDLNFKAKNPQ